MSKNEDLPQYLLELINENIPHTMDVPWFKVQDRTMKRMIIIKYNMHATNQNYRGDLYFKTDNLCGCLVDSGKMSRYKFNFFLISDEEDDDPSPSRPVDILCIDEILAVGKCDSCQKMIWTEFIQLNKI